MSVLEKYRIDSNKNCYGLAVDYSRNTVNHEIARERGGLLCFSLEQRMRLLTALARMLRDRFLKVHVKAELVAVETTSKRSMGSDITI